MRKFHNIIYSGFPAVTVRSKVCDGKIVDVIQKEDAGIFRVYEVCDKCGKNYGLNPMVISSAQMTIPEVVLNGLNFINNNNQFSLF